MVPTDDLCGGRDVAMACISETIPHKETPGEIVPSVACVAMAIQPSGTGILIPPLESTRRFTDVVPTGKRRRRMHPGITVAAGNVLGDYVDQAGRDHPLTDDAGSGGRVDQVSR